MKNTTKTKNLLWICILLLYTSIVNAQTIGSFNSVQPGTQLQNLVIPSTHTFQRIIQSGNALSLGGNLGASLDFTGYVPINGSSQNGFLSISSETTPAECSILSVNYNTLNQLWNITSSGKVNFPSAEIGTVDRFCSGTVTPNNTIMVAEESLVAGDVNGDGYQDNGWIIEIDPVTRTVINQDAAGGADKIWAIGRQSHENVAIKSDRSIIYTGADANPTGYLYKFVPNVAGNYSSGSLYVLQTTSALGTGTWQLIANNTIAERNNVVTASTSAGAYNFNGIEDVELGPDGKVYFAAKGPGVIYRLNDNGTTVSNLEVFVASTNYDVDGAGPYAAEAWGIGNDNLAFDGEGNLWVLQDGSRNHIWVVAPTHTASNPAVKLFANTPLGSEPTGITFSPDYKFLFISFQHPSTSNTASQLDASGANVIFNNHTTVVISRKEFLGVQVCNAPTGLSTAGITSTDASISWQPVSGAISYDADYKLNSSSTWANAATATKATSVNLVGLSSGSLYDWRVKTNCSINTSSYTTAQFTTLSQVSSCPGIYDTATNGNTSGAATIALNTDIKGTIAPKNDNDYYKFIITTGGTITLSLTTLPTNYQLALLNSAGTQIGLSQNNGTINENINVTVAAGTYYARVFPKGNVSSATSCYTLKITTGTAARIGYENKIKAEEPENNNSVAIYPNPAVQKLFVNINNLINNTELNIYNISGKLVLKQQTSEPTTEVNISRLSTGLYILNVKEGSKFHNLKFMKE